MTHLLQETRISFGDLAREQGLAESTPWRWAKHGVNGVLLESFSIGARRYTTREAWQRFVEATTAANDLAGPRLCLQTRSAQQR